ncbi:ABC transporter substrate-binding protein [Saccharomonospora glauca]|uniref:Periplasmic component of amino acid ABC-type transporter/signal transduction system n=1 Tax=Saccharomonospora glauca K62 TaxID=928724 RepID=I1D4H6_9PSEU|nr:ABC transporter substrate-binding protein [Saccharomonospora glauca]EIE99850.1 periplasmic component of amino acid ABC-type transporter/signal transduction system [Saccharomonospora glauca K62]
MSQVGRMRKGLALLLTMASAVLMGCSGGGSTDVLADVRDSGTLRVALTQANPPWNFLDDGKPVGYDVDVAHEVARRIGVDNVEFVASNFQSFIEGVRAERFDIVISGQTITEERKQQVSFSRPYQVNGVAIFVPSGDRSIGSLSDLEDKVVAVSAGTTQEQFAREEIQGAQVKTYQNATLGLTDLARGNADAMLVSRFQGSYLAKQNDLAVKPVGKLLESEVNGMSFRKGSPAFKKEIDKAIASMIADGTLSRISQQWLGLDMVPELNALPPEQG